MEKEHVKIKFKKHTIAHVSRKAVQNLDLGHFEPIPSTFSREI